MENFTQSTTGKISPSRRGFLRLTGTMAAAAGITAALSACAPRSDSASSGSGASGSNTDTINAAISYELGTNGFDPMTTSAALTLAANWHTMEGLTEVMPSGDREVYAALAKELPTKVDDTTYEATLRDGAVFHDGTEVTTDDVVFSFERVLDPENASLYSSFLTFMDGVKKKDDKTVTITLKQPFSLVNERLAVVKIVPKAAVEKDAKAFDSNPVGTGPYKMTDNSASSKELVFEKFEDYTGPKPAKAATMKWQIVPDESTRTNALTSNQVSAIDSVPYLSIDTLKNSATVESVQGFGLLFAMFNCGSQPFDNLKNRQAVMYAIDMNKVIDTAFLGNATAATSFLEETHPAYKKASTVYSLDQEKAKSLFQETGLSSIRMLCTDHDWVKKATPIIKESLEAAGLSVEFQEKKSADVYNTIDGKPDSFDMVVAPGDPSVFGNDPDLFMRWWYSADTWTDQRMHWKGSPSYDKLQKILDDASSMDGSDREAKWGEAFDLLSEEVSLYPLLHRKTPTAWKDDQLEGFKPLSTTGLSFLDVAPAS